MLAWRSATVCFCSSCIYAHDLLCQSSPRLLHFDDAKNSIKCRTLCNLEYYSSLRPATVSELLAKILSRNTVAVFVDVLIILTHMRRRLVTRLYGRSSLLHASVYYLRVVAKNGYRLSLNWRTPNSAFCACSVSDWNAGVTLPRVNSKTVGFLDFYSARGRRKLDLLPREFNNGEYQPRSTAIQSPRRRTDTDVCGAPP